MVDRTRGASPRRRIVILAACLALLSGVLPASGATANDLAEARRQRAELQTRLDDATRRLAELEAAEAEIADDREALTRRLDELGVEIATAEARLAGRVRSLYKHGHVDPMMVLFTSGEADVLSRAAIVASLVRGDKVQTEVAGARRTEAKAVAERLELREQQLTELRAAQEAAYAQLERDFVAAAGIVRRLEEEEQARIDAERRRQAQAEARRREAERARRTVPTVGGYTCPVAAPRSFTDTWGAPRSGGRRHRGTDIMAPRGAHLFAVTSGTVQIRGYGRNAGYWLILRGDDGNRYYYMHLQGFAVGSQRVTGGQLIGYNGDTGNARGTPHLHFELHPGGGSAVNPYPFLRRVCG